MSTPLRTKLARTLAVAVVAACASVSSTLDAAEPRTKVFLNGKPAPVFFNDGDSFRVLGGTYKGAKARLSGYNTLESYGPVHQWGDWTEKELYTIAKMATMFARKRVWKCTSDGKLDTYGRMLMWCPELAEAMVRNGYAHHMTITDEPARAILIDAQNEAMAKRRGIWAHGVPAFVLTSMHSVEEDVNGRGTYNRLVSTADGHSVKWKHSTKHNECDKVCHYVYDIDNEKVEAVVTELKADDKAKAWVGALSDTDLHAVVLEFAKFHHAGRAIAKDDREAFKNYLMSKYVALGKFGDVERKPGACMTHVAFKRRYGEGRAQCLK